MDCPSAVEADPDPVLLVDRVGGTDWPEELGSEAFIAELAEKGAALLRGRVRESVARHLSHI